ncbi:MAG: 30S ribosomal protein S12 methylthiotransferase RimO [Lachnospiraceae bacterium]|nr:30S ribosomal protein S12 methylthiotransferase RimO [Lachnospiraceae bacterium]
MKLLPVPLGCDKNLCDLEEMLGILDKKGISITDDPNEADIILINSCSFIGDAKEESINTIIDMAGYKESAGNGGCCKALIVSGCLAQRYSEEITKELPEVDAIVGTTSYQSIGEVIDKCLKGDKTVIVNDADSPLYRGGERLLTTGGHFAYLKIAEGCNKRCTYCIIPFLRGNYRSYPMEELAEKAERLAEGGVKELIIVAQETTLYGVDLYGEKTLPKLLRTLCKIDGIEWIRLLYTYPEEIDDELIRVMAEEKKICHYIDMPIQHASDTVLKRMGRRTDRKSLTELILRIRERIPDIAIRTTLISGFPGETDKDHEILYNFVDETEFDRLGVFTYSAEEGTKAFEMSGQVPDEIMRERRDELMLLQQEIAFEKAESRIGKTYRVFVEGRLEEDDVYVGRTYMDAPDVDGMIFFKSDRSFMSGDFATVRVTGAREYDLIGESEDESAQ